MTLRAVTIAMFIVSFCTVAVSAQESDTTGALRQVGLSADRFVGIGGTTEPIRKLIGNVRLVQDNTTLRSALATQWVERDHILFEGSVTIVDEGDTLRADSVLYFRKTKIGNATGNVVLNDDEVTVTSVGAVYDVDRKHSRFDRGVQLVDSVSTLTGGQGEYFSEEERAHFYNDVVFRDSTNTIFADTLIYYRETEIATATGNVLIHVVDQSADSSSAPDIFRIAGPDATSNRRENSNRLTSRSVALRLGADSTGAYTDSLLINADRLASIRTDSTDTINGGGNVQVWSVDVAALADSLVIRSDDDAADEIILTGSPIIWIDDSQLVGDTIKVFVRDEEIDSVFATGSVFLARPDSVSGRIQQVTGRTLYGRFLADSEQVFTIGPNAEAIHYVSRENQLEGAVRASADTIVFYIKDEKPTKINVISGVEGLYYEADNLPAGLQLNGFSWEPERRPTKSLLMSEWPANMHAANSAVAVR